MIKLLLSLLMFLISLYWVGDRIRRVARLDEFLGNVELRFSNFNEIVKGIEVRDAIQILGSTAGRISLLCGGIVLVFALVDGRSPSLGSPLGVITALSFGEWLATRWATLSTKAERHYENALNVLGNMAFPWLILVIVVGYLFGPQLLGLMAGLGVSPSDTKIIVILPLFLRSMYVTNADSGGGQWLPRVRLSEQRCNVGVSEARNPCRWTGETAIYRGESLGLQNPTMLERKRPDGKALRLF
jgi:hypothetical protein